MPAAIETGEEASGRQEPDRGSSVALDNYLPSVITLFYWTAWTALGVWGSRLPFTYRRDGWWMVLGLFVLTHADVRPACEVRRPLRAVAVLLASLACAMLLYGTSDWWFSVFEGWQSANSDGLIRQTLKRAWFVVLYLLGTLLAAGVLVFPFRRALGRYTVVALAFGGFLTTVWMQSDLVLSAASWHQSWFVNSMLLFRAVIVGAGTAAIAAHLGTSGHQEGSFSFIDRLWRGQLPVRWILLVVFPLTLLAALALAFTWVHVYGPDGSLAVDKQLLAVCVNVLLPGVLICTGSLIALRALGRAAKHRPWSSHLAQVLIVLIAAPALVSEAWLNGIPAGSKLRSSLAVVLGTAYGYRISPDGTEITLDGPITYGTGDELERQLRRYPSIRRLRLNSGGGLFDEARTAAAAVSKRHLDTIVTEHCESACPLIFLAGANRVLATGAKLGFHRSNVDNPMIPRWSSACSDFQQYGVTTEFCRRMDAVDPLSMWYPTREELIAAHII